MSTSTVDLAAEPIVVRGPSLEDALAAAEAALGGPARAIKADRIRRGGIGGFFATDLGVEVTAVPLEPTLRPTERLIDTDPDLFPTLEADRFDVVGLAADRAATQRPDLRADGPSATPTPRPAPTRTDEPRAEARPVDFDSLDFDAPPGSFEAALDRLVSSAGLKDGRPQAAPISHTPVRDPGTRAATAASVAPIVMPQAPTAAPAVVQAPTAPAPVAKSALHSMTPRPQQPGTLATTASASASFAAPVPAPMPTVPARTAAPIAPSAAPADATRHHAEMAAVAAGDLLGRVLDRPGTGQVSVTITITGADGTKCRAEARSERPEGHDGPTQRH